VIFQELKPAVRDTLIKIVSGLINDVFATLPYKEWFIAEQ
jgi:hypothetical protein